MCTCFKKFKKILSRPIFLLGTLFFVGAIVPGAYFFNPGTASAEGTFEQIIAKLQEQVRVLTQQWAALQGQQAAVASSATPSSLSAFSRNLSFGMRNDPDVEKLQNFLTQWGYYVGPIDGDFFLPTLKSVKKFQKSQNVAHISATGFFGPQSRAVANALISGTATIVTNTGDTAAATKRGVTAARNLSPARAPVISIITPTSGSIGDKVTLTGTGFTTTGNNINFGGIVNAVVNLSSTDGKTLTFTVPSQLCNQLSGSAVCPPLKPGTYDVWVTNANGRSNSVTFEVTKSGGGTPAVEVKVDAANLSDFSSRVLLRQTPENISEPKNLSEAFSQISAVRSTAVPPTTLDGSFAMTLSIDHANY